MGENAKDGRPADSGEGPSFDPPSGEFLGLISLDFAREHLILSGGRRDGTERLLVAASTNPAAAFNVGVRLGIPVETQIAEEEPLARAIDEAYGSRQRAVESVEALDQVEDLDEQLVHADGDLLATQGKGTVIRFVDRTLFEALGRDASDLHVQPLADGALLRCRVDGALHTLREIPKGLAKAVVSRIKVMGRMDIAERRVAQDGRATVRIGERPIDLRISTFPTNYGERAVIRLLDNSRRLCDFDSLGMPPDLATRFLGCAGRANGIVLVTGPTGSGKTTTLYSTLRRIASSQVNVMTIEDPIEYDLSTVGLNVSQAQVNAKKGLTFATGLRSVLRQDPDIILVGEIRDADTARMAIQSSLTGHLVFSTLHTNDAPSAVTRLVDLGVEPYLLSASLSAVLAQRLVRVRHRECSGKGCELCFGTGLLGRTGVFELMMIDEEMRERIHGRPDAGALRALARKGGMRSLQEEGERLVAAGRTSAEEVERVLQGAL